MERPPVTAMPFYAPGSNSKPSFAGILAKGTKTLGVQTTPGPQIQPTAQTAVGKSTLSMNVQTTNMQVKSEKQTVTTADEVEDVPANPMELPVEPGNGLRVG